MIEIALTSQDVETFKDLTTRLNQAKLAHSNACLTLRDAQRQLANIEAAVKVRAGEVDEANVTVNQNLVRVLKHVGRIEDPIINSSTWNIDLEAGLIRQTK